MRDKLLKPRIWIFHVCELINIGDLERYADIDFNSEYFTYHDNSAGLMSEYRAVIWRTPHVLKNDPKRSNQLIDYLNKKNGLFVFLYDKFKVDGNASSMSILSKLFSEEFDANISDTYNHTISKKFKITQDGNVSPFREYLEFEPQHSCLSFKAHDNLIPLAVNLDNEPIAFTFKSSKSHSYIIPSPINDDHLNLFFNNLTEAVSRLGTDYEEAPTWTKDYQLKGMKEYQTKIKEIRVNIETLNTKLSSMQNHLNKKVWLRDTLLSRDGEALEKAVEFVFKEIGFAPKPGPTGQEDITFSYAGINFLAEIKGATSSASEKHIKQLHAKLTIFHEREKVPSKGVLIINPWRQYPPSERENDSRMIFPDAIQSLVSIWEFCLITTIQLFEIYKLHLADTLDKEKLAKNMSNTVGPLQNIA